ncbi:hypothetical protein JAAARDRAFT_36637 [Jaapia argillacea MUCL 33604]|uniref:Uncharacterized protein n=1 Tax=Jaapia argillacea MUCL 33604 TaxID=933084 RepID=A0A067Q1L9_9AGAM|nr:hypothetical protein JAAARDRAFT_36637 [Jaapia argillacea MUCL 33604]
MIVIEETTQTKDARLNAQRNSGPISGPAPPPYPGPYQAAYQTHAVPPPHPVNRETAGRRFFRAFFVAVLIWFLLGMLTRSMVDLANSARHHGQYATFDQLPGSLRGWPEASDGRIDHCTSFRDRESVTSSNSTTAASGTASAHFELPASSDVLYLFARGSKVYGNVEITDSSDVLDVVKVDMTITYSREEALARATICKLSRSGGHNGVGIFTPSWPGTSPMDFLRFDIVVRLPATSIDTPLELKTFETDLPMFSHVIDDLERKVQFESISLRSSNMMISSAGISANNAEIKTSNAPIEGSFKTDNSLTLVTSNAHIKASVGLYSKQNKFATQVDMRTSNGPIESDISLTSSEGSSGGSFKVIGSTSNAHLDVQFPVSPVSSRLNVDLKTSNAPATVAMHPAYEGTFNLRTSNLRPSIESPDTVEDPSGKGRKRSVYQSSYTRGNIEGMVYWDKLNRDAGDVHVKSSNAPIRLVLGW